MKEDMKKDPATGKMLRQVSLEPSDLAAYKELLDEHLHWLSIAQDFVPQSDHIKQIYSRFTKMRKDIEELIHYGVPTETETESD
jgi:hypothetical protein